MARHWGSKSPFTFQKNKTNNGPFSRWKGTKKNSGEIVIPPYSNTSPLSEVEDGTFSETSKSYLSRIQDAVRFPFRKLSNSIKICIMKVFEKK